MKILESLRLTCEKASGWDIAAFAIVAIAIAAGFLSVALKFILWVFATPFVALVCFGVLATIWLVLAAFIRGFRFICRWLDTHWDMTEEARMREDQP